MRRFASNRSQSRRDILLKAGFTRVTSMAGGLLQWQSKGYPLVSGQWIAAAGASGGANLLRGAHDAVRSA